MTWAAIAEVGLAGVLFIWLISPAAAEKAGYGFVFSSILLVLSMLFTAVGVLTLLAAPRLSRGFRLTVTLLLAAIAGGVLPLAMTGLFTAQSRGYRLLLVLAVVGMEFLAVRIPRVVDPRPS